MNPSLSVTQETSIRCEASPPATPDLRRNNVVGKSVRALLTTAIALVGILVAPPASYAAPTTTNTIHASFTGTTVQGIDPFIQGVDCMSGGPLYTVTHVVDQVRHETVTGAGRHVSLHENVNWTAVPLKDPALPTASGTYTINIGGQENPGGAFSGPVTMNIQGSYDDGRRINQHIVQQLNVTPQGTFFFREHCH